jgi:alpha-glucosidase (family GH31 glycosyl hydrolase)
MRKLWYLLIIPVLAISCQQNPHKGVKLQTKGKDKNVNLTFYNSILEDSLSLTGIPGKNEGSIYFSTYDGKTWLKGEPDKTRRDTSGFYAEWNLDDRKVFVKVKRNEQNFDVEFNAKPNDDIMGWGFNLEANDKEYFTGLFERTVDGSQSKSWEEGIEQGMNMRGLQVDMKLKATMTVYAPFYVSTRGYGLFIKGTWPGHYDLCKEVNDRVQIDFDGPNLRFRLYTDESPMEIVKAHALDAGPSIIPPKWAFSPWRWRDAHKHQETYYDGTPVNAPYNSMLVEDILMMEALDIPCGAYWIDRPWGTAPAGYGDFEWDTDRIPNPKKMIDWLASKNINFMLWIAPWVNGNMADTAQKRNYSMPQKRVKWAGVRELIDFTNPEAKKWWQEKGLAKLLKQGVKGFKLDRGDELILPYRDSTVYDGRSCREFRNAYPVEYVKATYEISKKIHGDDFMLLPRAAYTGSQKYGAFWGGDIGSPPEGLRASIIALQKASVLGYPLWGSDIGGYWHGDLDREVTSRWLAFGCFSPIMEVGPTENRGLWELDRNPTYDPQTLAIWRLYATLHEQLKDYSHEAAQLAHETGMPIVRPLSMIAPEQEKALKDWQTYMYGPDILVSAIWRKGKKKHSLYLPEGEKWVDAWNKDKVYKGGKTIKVETPMYKIPIFIRQGASVELGDLNALYQESLKIAKDQPDMKTLEEQADFQVSQ